MIEKYVSLLNRSFSRVTAPLVLAAGLGLSGCGTTMRHLDKVSCEDKEVTTFNLGKAESADKTKTVEVGLAGKFSTRSEKTLGVNQACLDAQRAVRVGLTVSEETGDYYSAALRTLIVYYNAATEELRLHIATRLSQLHRLSMDDLPKLELAARKRELARDGHNTDFDCRVVDGKRHCRILKEEPKGQDPLKSLPIPETAASAPAPK